MKKLYAMLMASVMMIAMVVPTIAAPSPSGSVITPSPSGTVISSSSDSTSTATPAASALMNSGSTVAATVAGASATALTETYANSVLAVTSNAQVLQDLNVPTTAKLVAAIDVSYSGTIPAGGVQIPFVVSSAKKGDLVYVLHRQSAAPYQWEVVGQAVLGDDLTVVGTFTSFSPVAFMVVNAADVAATGVKAPKTGEF